jgi:signal peptidase II
MYFVMAAVIAGADQYTKFLVITRMKFGSSIEIIPGFFSFTFIKNYGAAFGLFQRQLAVFVIVGLVAVTVIVIYSILISEKEYLLQTGLAFLLGGAVGNFIDRLRFGYVIDFLDLHHGKWHWPVFNIADIAIDIGVVLILLKFLFLEDEDQETGPVQN